MALLYLVGLIFLAKIVMDSPVGKAMGDSIRSFSARAAPKGAASQADMERARRDIEALRDRVDRIVEEQSFITRLLTESRPLSLGSGEASDEDVRKMSGGRDGHE
ncbi:MAG: hypothetical protein V3U38_07470 [Gemmatimonadota bacterium]